MRTFTFLVVFLLSFSLVAAVSIDVNNVNNEQGDIVSISIKGCPGWSALKVYNAKTPIPEMADMGHGTGDWEMNYNTDSDASDGKYLLSASCDDGKTAEKNFCVDADGCVASGSTGGDTASAGTSTGRGKSGGGGSCWPSWSCGQWSFCSKDLKQTRTCTDIKRCKQPKTEEQACAKCEESWICSGWSECSGSQQKRTCQDEHACGTVLSKPKLQKGCKAPEPAPMPTRVSRQMPSPNYYQQQAPPPPKYTPPPTAPAQVQQPAKFDIGKMWEEYMIFIIAGPSGLVLLIIIIVLIVHFTHKEKKVFNIDELKNWIKQEQAAGTSNEDIRKILADHTGWKEEDIHEAFVELQEEEVTKPVSSMDRPAPGQPLEELGKPPGQPAAEQPTEAQPAPAEQPAEAQPTPAEQPAEQQPAAEQPAEAQPAAPAEQPAQPTDEQK